MRIALSLSYAGQHYHGWQRQQHATSVQATVEAALAKLACQPISTVCAGRTDAGVHATEQIIHFDTDIARDEKAWLMGTNSHLPADIVVNWAKVVPEEFHARFSASARRYFYIIYNHATRPAILAQQVTWHYQPLNTRLMQHSAQHLLGEHDFSSFRAAECQSHSTNRHIYYIAIKRLEKLVIIDICANAFLHHMVRNIVGTLVKVGEGQAAPEWSAKVLAARDRRVAGKTMPAAGLYLVGVQYDKTFKLPKPSGIGPWFCHMLL